MTGPAAGLGIDETPLLIMAGAPVPVASPTIEVTGAAQAGLIRPFEAGDAGVVASLFMKTFRKTDEDAPPGLISFFAETFTAPARDQNDSASRVFVDADRGVTGFVGVVPTVYVVDGRPIEVAVAGSLMVENAAANPMAGARLLRSVATGGYAAIFSETSNAISKRMWDRTGGRAIPGYSLDFLKVLQPAGFALALAALRLPPAGLLAPPIRLLDRLAIKAIPQSAAPDPTATDEAVGVETAADLIFALTEARGLRPDWTPQAIATRLKSALSKAAYGEPVLRMVRSRRSEPVGLYLYHVRASGIAHVTHALFRRGFGAEIVARLIADARRNGAVALKGRAEPENLDALSDAGAFFLRRSAFTVHGADEETLRHLQSGDAFVTGLAGETWMRLIGDRFD